MTKPSFESYTAGYELNNDAYECGDVVPFAMDHEVADLGRARESRTLGKIEFKDGRQDLFVAFGAAGRSNLRDQALNQPEQIHPIKVNPPPLMVVSKTNLAVSDATRYTSVWQAEQAHQFNHALQSASHQVAELAELSL